MDHRLRILKSVLVFIFFAGILFGALALLPALAQTPQHGRAAPDEPLSPELGDVSAQLLVSSTTGYVIDDGDTGFTPPPPYPTGNWSYFAAGGYKGDCLYTLADNSGDVAEWRPDLAAGFYEVQVHYWADSTWQRDDALYTIVCADGTFTRRIDQKRNAAGVLVPTPGGNSDWVSLGLYRFNGGTSGYVTLSDNPTVWGSGTNVVADAVRFLPVEVWVDDSYTPVGTNEGHLWGVTAFDNMRSGIEAVANYGAVYVRPGTYYQYITVTKAITLSGAGSASTVITVPAATATAIEWLASNARISGFTIESAGAPYGIRNYDSAAATWRYDVSGYRIADNAIRGFQYGIYLRRTKGEISSNTIYNNANIGIWLREFPSGAGAGPTTVSGNILYANGSGATDRDIHVEDSYTGTLVSGNTITGSGAASEAGIYVFNKAGDLTLSGNRVTGCTSGVWILTNSGANIQIQKVNLQGNTITGGTTGVHVQWIAGASSLWQVIAGGSVANANSIYGNSGYELALTNYGVPVTATYNYWGVCTLRGIEDEIWHNYDAGGLGTVTYEPALCVPYTITVQAAPTTLPADGTSTAVITATVRDAANYPCSGTMVGITTSLGSVPYGYAEAESAAVIKTGGWAAFVDARAAGSAYIAFSSVPPPAGVEATWSFTGEAVSLIYPVNVGGGVADVSVDGSYVRTINFNSATLQWQVESLVIGTLSPGPHTVRVTHQGGGWVWLDAFRSGALTTGQGRLVTALTSATVPGTAAIWATVYDGRIITAVPPPYPFRVATTTVTFLATDVSITKSATPLSLRPGQDVTYTITYRNDGLVPATDVLVTDTLPAGFDYVRSSSSPSHEPPNYVAGPPVQWVWNIGNVAPGATGVITLVARTNPAFAWPSTPISCTNVAQISSKVADTAAGNNTASAAATVTPAPAGQVTVIAYPTTIPADGLATSTITATVLDANSNPVVDGTPITFTTTLNTVFIPGATATKVVTTTGGVATATLQAGTVAGTARVTANAGTAEGYVDIQLVPLAPWWVDISASPTVIQVSNGDIFSSLRITVTDVYANLVGGASVTLTTTAGFLRAPTGITGTTIYVTTTNGLALASLASSSTVTTATVTAAITTTGRPTDSVRVFFEAGPPYLITSVAYPYPDPIRVCGGQAVITATIRDRFGNLVANDTEVNFNVVPGECGDMYPRRTVTSNGIAVSTVRTGACRLSMLHVYIMSQRGAGRAEYYQPINLKEGLPFNIGLTASPPTIPVGGRETEIRALVQDCAGNNVADGTVITFAASSLGIISPTVTSTINGRAYAAFRSGCTMGTAVITATADTRSVTTSVVLEAGPADYISVGPPIPNVIRNCSGNALIVATLYDVCGNLVKDNTPVQFTPMYNYVRASPDLAFTRGGVVSTTVYAISKTLGTWPTSLEQIDVTSPGAMPGFTSLTIRAGLPSIVDLSANPQEIPINGDANGYNIMVGAQVQDCSGTPVEDGTPVILETDLGFFWESGTRSAIRLTVNGLVSATLTSQSVAGTVTIVATADSATDRTWVRFLPGEPWQLDVWSYPTTIPADGHSESLITARVKDEYNNPVLQGITVTFVTDYGRFAGSGTILYTTTTNSNGFAFATLVADMTPRTALVRAIAYNDRQGYTYVFFVTPPERRYLYMPLVTKRFRR